MRELLRNVEEIKERWHLNAGFGIKWDSINDTSVPHEDFLEMSGRRVSLIVRYGVGCNGSLILSKKIIWPTLRTIPNDTKASLKQDYDKETAPGIFVNDNLILEEKPYCFILDGILTIKSRTSEELEITRTIFPSTENSAVIEKFQLINMSEKDVKVAIKHPQGSIAARGCHGIYMLEVLCDAPEVLLTLSPGESVAFGVYYNGRKLMEPLVKLNLDKEVAGRKNKVLKLMGSLKLDTPDPVLNCAFDFSKIRAAESIFKTKCGLIHSPGGEPYYAAVWANDEAEYAGPFFPFLGDEGGNEASINCYKLYQPFMGPDYHAIPSSIVAEGLDIWEGAGDRGDAAMYAYGASRFVLAFGDMKTAKELWPAIEWCLEFCNRKINPEGVVASDHDELEGRFPCGKANLSTSSLTYGALISAANLACELGNPELAETYRRRADRLYDAIEEFFGATVEGFDTYRYYEENTVLRSWICIPLAMGIMKRKEGTLAALFSPRLWVNGGLATQAGEETVWDRSTLYAFRGALAAGAVEKVLPYINQYVHSRLLGEHVPYAVEAYPEGNGRHLSAESALFCRVFTEGMFGITPTGLKSFSCKPQMPNDWNRMALRSVMAFGREFDITVERADSKLAVAIFVSGTQVCQYLCDSGESIDVDFSELS